ncbi:anoctamin-7-like, partial [Saccostrea cucullata]|uniref:anoctamin-7-like n=1 Tax=Saccostrea cuccullata TaxID=36930 RepID=UPI002ED6818E
VPNAVFILILGKVRNHSSIISAVLNAVFILILGKVRNNSSIISAVLNAVCILILGKIYEILAFKLTEWENHRTQTRYDDALVTKMFAFQFVNSYASCFYIAFFRGRFSVFGYTDECVGDRGTMYVTAFFPKSSFS